MHDTDTRSCTSTAENAGQDTGIAAIQTRRLQTPAGVTLAWDRFGTGPPLVLVHGSFFDQRSNWQFVAPELAHHFTVHALARRGRGASDATVGHSVADEAEDVAALIAAVGSPVHLLGHSYGALIALEAARRVRDRIAKLVLYEPPLPEAEAGRETEALEGFADAGDWDMFTATFVQAELTLSDSALAELRATPIWSQFVAAAPPTRHDLLALPRHVFDPQRFAGLAMPVMLQIGTESRRETYATDALAAVLPDARVAELPEQGHAAMLIAPELYARQVIDFLRG